MATVYYFLDDAPRYRVGVGSPGRASVVETRTRIAGFDAVFVNGVYRSTDPNEQSGLAIWAARGGGVSKQRWLEVWSQKAPAALVADVQANG